MNPPLGRRIKRYLLTGFLIITPIGITYLVLAWLVATLDHWLAPLSATLLGRHIPGLGLFMGLILLLGIGFLGSNIAGKHILEAFEDILSYIPGFNWIYSAVKQLTEVFSPEGKLRFQSVVLVEYPRPEVLSLGFVTNQLQLQGDDGKKRTVFSVYIPTNHLYIGDIILVPEAKILKTDLTLQQGIQGIFSAGASIPEALKYRAESS